MEKCGMAEPHPFPLGPSPWCFRTGSILPPPRTVVQKQTSESPQGIRLRLGIKGLNGFTCSAVDPVSLDMALSASLRLANVTIIVDTIGTDKSSRSRKKDFGVARTSPHASLIVFIVFSLSMHAKFSVCSAPAKDTPSHRFMRTTWYSDIR